MSASPSANSAEEWLDRLQAGGYRLTEPRRAVAEAVAASQRALSATEVFDLARERHPALGLVTVYRTLARLETLGLVQRVHQPDGCQAFIAAATGHQHLLLCQTCGRAEYFTGDDLDELIANLERQSGYLIRDHWLQLFGNCAGCR